MLFFHVCLIIQSFVPLVREGPLHPYACNAALVSEVLSRGTLKSVNVDRNWKYVISPTLFTITASFRNLGKMNRGVPTAKSEKVRQYVGNFWGCPSTGTHATGTHIWVVLMEQLHQLCVYNPDECCCWRNVYFGHRFSGYCLWSTITDLMNNGVSTSQYS